MQEMGTQLKHQTNFNQLTLISIKISIAQEKRRAKARLDTT
jgi:hypothetical protein